MSPHLTSPHLTSPHLTSPHRTKLTKLLLTACGALAMMVVGGLVVWAQVSSTTEAEKIPRTIHYEGYLELNGRAVDWEEGTKVMILTLTNNPSEVGATFYRTSLKPKVEAGYFAVDIEIPPTTTEHDYDWVFNQANSIYLSITVDNVPLAGVQKIMPVPFAVRAAQADTATWATNAGHADAATRATSAGQADFATSATYAASAPVTDGIFKAIHLTATNLAVTNKIFLPAITPYVVSSGTLTTAVQSYCALTAVNSGCHLAYNSSNGTWTLIAPSTYCEIACF